MAEIMTDLIAYARRRNWSVSTSIERSPSGRRRWPVLAARQPGVLVYVQLTSGQHSRIRLAEFRRPGGNGGYLPEHGGYFDTATSIRKIKNWLDSPGQQGTGDRP